MMHPRERASRKLFIANCAVFKVLRKDIMYKYYIISTLIKACTNGGGYAVARRPYYEGGQRHVICSPTGEAQGHTVRTRLHTSRMLEEKEDELCTM